MKIKLVKQHTALVAKLLLSVLVVSLSLSTQLTLANSAAVDLDALLKQVESGRLQESKENTAREQRFLQDRNQQKTMLAAMKKELAKQEALSSQLEKQFEANDKLLVKAEQRLRERLGSLGELFGHLTSAAGDARSNFETSVISVDYPGRDQFLNELVEVTSSGTDLPSIQQIEGLWFEMQREMTEQGRVVSFSTDVAEAAGDTVKKKVIRIGAFNVVDENGKYLSYEGGHLKELARQPASKYTSAAAELFDSQNGVIKIGIDPTGPSGGSLLAALINTPTLMERWHQGGLVGYVITIVGLIALVLALLRIAVLSKVGIKVNAQLQSDTAVNDNPLGRVLIAAEENTSVDLEVMELKINEAILKELPKLQSFEAILKIIAAVAPLLGLLGTVTGMILTFQAITIYGAGDPQAMAGGISSALVTTVLGLIVAIPTVLMHTVVSGRSKRIIHILEEQAAGIVAMYQESRHQ